MTSTTTNTTLYGIKNCDTVKKARAWLDKKNAPYQFHDFRTDGLTIKQVKAWIDALGLEVIVNKRSTTWKALSDADKDDAINNVSKAAVIICDNPTLIKRPLLIHKDIIQVGFKEALYQTIF